MRPCSGSCRGGGCGCFDWSLHCSCCCSVEGGGSPAKGDPVLDAVAATVAPAAADVVVVGSVVVAGSAAADAVVVVAVAAADGVWHAGVGPDLDKDRLALPDSGSEK